VGVDLNTASPALLRYVSGLNQLTARRLCEYRKEHGPFRNREQLRDVPGFGEMTFIQATGFLKIAGGDNPLDSTWIHPESYAVAGRALESLELSAAELADKEKAAATAERIAAVDLDATAEQLQVGKLTLEDILAQLARPGRDPREDLPAPMFKKGVLKLEDLDQGMELTGTVLNVVDFGAFVDIGMHDSGLVHVSRLADKFIRDPHEVVAVGDIVKVWVVEVDKQRRRVSLTMIQPGTQRTRPPRRGAKSDAEKTSAETPTGEGRSQGRDKSREKSRDKSREKSGDKPRGKRRDSRRGGPKGGPRSRGDQRGRRATKEQYRPKPRPKPVIPITDEMKTGKEPMRTFGDLAQFFENQQDQDGDQQESQPESQTKPSENEAQAPQAEAAPEESQAIEQTADAATDQPDTAQDPPKPAENDTESTA